MACSASDRSLALVVLIALLGVSILLAGCYWESWQSVHADELTLSLEPAEPIPGEPLVITVSAPRAGSLSLGVVQFDGIGGAWAGVGERLSQRFDAVGEDPIFYWAGAHQRDRHGIAVLHETEPVARFLGAAAERARFEVTIATRPDADGGLYVTLTHDGPTNATAAGWSTAKSDQETTAGLLQFTRAANARTFEASLPSDHLSEGALVTILAYVQGTDGASHGTASTQIRHETT